MGESGCRGWPPAPQARPSGLTGALSTGCRREHCCRPSVGPIPQVRAAGDQPRSRLSAGPLPRTGLREPCVQALRDKNTAFVSRTVPSRVVLLKAFPVGRLEVAGAAQGGCGLFTAAFC